ncbi:helix-turn-helix domain-containing protein [Candidatus Peregrinibacteria bacterium]|nr:helix-turn-helix domain-containing protein [Candidatus Peregrinibacteria bacterium]
MEKSFQNEFSSSSWHDQNEPWWMRSGDVCEMLNISSSSLQNYRIRGLIPAYKLGSTWFYKYHEIIEVLENNKTREGGKNE